MHDTGFRRSSRRAAPLLGSARPCRGAARLPRVRWRRRRRQRGRGRRWHAGRILPATARRLLRRRELRATLGSRSGDLRVARLPPRRDALALALAFAFAPVARTLVVGALALARTHAPLGSQLGGGAQAQHEADRRRPHAPVPRAGGGASGAAELEAGWRQGGACALGSRLELARVRGTCGYVGGARPLAGDEEGCTL